MNSPQKIQSDIAAQDWAAIVVGIFIILAGLGIAVFSSTVSGLLLVIVGVLVLGFGRLDAALMSITTNQCVIIDLQKETIRELRKLSDSGGKNRDA